MYFAFFGTGIFAKWPYYKYKQYVVNDQLELFIQYKQDLDSNRKKVSSDTFYFYFYFTGR